jgi:hypothetical protein
LAVLTVILTHLGAPLVEKQLSCLRTLAPGSRFVILHGGKRADFDQLTERDAVFIDDPTLRGPHYDKSANDQLDAIHERWVRDDPSIDLIYIVEYDHLILRADFEQRLEELAERSAAGLFAKAASARNDSNWAHYLRLRGDARLNDYVASISQRDDPSIRWGCLGTGLLLRREALEAFCALPSPPPLYIELFVPTVLYHLGFDVADIDALSDLYSAVRFLPEMSSQEVMAAYDAGKVFAHPYKGVDVLEAIVQNSRIEAPSG